MTETPLIYIVDDDQSMRASLQRLLTEVGFQTRVYGSTGEFLLDPLPDQPACLLLDVRLPGPSGLELQAALQRHNVEVPVIFLTGHANVASSVQAMKAGAVDFLEKPVEPDILFAAIRSALARGESRRAAHAAAEQRRKRFDLLNPSAARGVRGHCRRQTQQRDRARIGHLRTFGQDTTRRDDGETGRLLGRRARPRGRAIAALFQRRRPAVKA
jgi:FixJ family two-component response regulator